MLEMGNNERLMLKLMLSEPSKKWLLEELLSGIGWEDQVHVAGSGTALSDLGLVTIQESIETLVSLGAEGELALDEGLLESRLWNCLSSLPDSDRTMGRLFEEGFERHQVGPGIGLLKSMGVSIDSGKLVADDKSSLENEIELREKFISSLSEGAVPGSQLDDSMVKHFLGRKGLIAVEEHLSLIHI